MDGSEPAQRVLFGRRKGKPLRARQEALIATLLPQVRLDLARPAPADLRTLFAKPTTDLWMEIGFGGAEHLAAMAEAQPETGFIGCEPFLNGIAKALTQIEERELKTVRLHDGDAGEALDWLPEAALAGSYLLYPDPWPKARHNKRRFVSPGNLDRLARTIAPGGELRFATDIPDYADWTLRHVAAHGGFAWTAARADDWRRPWAGWPGTRYEAKALREGRVPAYFIFRRV